MASRHRRVGLAAAGQAGRSHPQRAISHAGPSARELGALQPKTARNLRATPPGLARPLTLGPARRGTLIIVVVAEAIKEKGSRSGCPSWSEIGLLRTYCTN